MNDEIILTCVPQIFPHRNVCIMEKDIVLEE